LLLTVKGLLKDEGRRNKMIDKQRNAKFSNAARKIAGELLGLDRVYE